MPPTKRLNTSYLCFFVTVKTNVGYTPIADFVVQSESGDQIKEALKVITSWNPEWNPPYFMTDYSDAEPLSLYFHNARFVGTFLS